MSEAAPKPELPTWARRLVGRPGVIAAFVWGLAEGTFFFVVPDVLLTLTALFRFKAAIRQTGAAVVGALVAGAVLFAWAARAPSAARATVLAVPFVHPAMRDKVDADYAEAGAAGLLRGPLSGIPYKLYAVEAPGRVGPAAFLVVSIAARLERLASGVLLFGAAGWLLRRRIAAHPRGALLGHGLYWVALYAFYWSRP